MPDLSLQKKAQRLRIYIGESDRWRGKPLDSALLETLRAQGMAGATIFRGAAGFGAHSHIHSTSNEVLSVDLPVVIEAIDTPEKMKSILELIYSMVREGLITLEDVQIVKYTHRFLNPLPADRLVFEVMTREVVSLSPELPVAQAWKQMLESLVKAMPVVDPTGRVIGILTDEDLLERAGIQQRLSVAIRMDPAEIKQDLRLLEDSTQKVADVMTRPVFTVQAGDTLGLATARMVKAGLKRLPVVDDEGKLVGVLSRLDILRQVVDSPYAVPPAHLPKGALRTVQDIMSSDIPMVNQDDDLSTMIEKFTQTDSHRLIVVDADGKPVGLISDSDIVARIQPARRRGILEAFRKLAKPPLGKETAFDLMSPGPLTAPPDLPVLDALKLMLEKSRKWMVVIAGNGKPLGLVDRQIMLEAMASFYENES